MQPPSRFGELVVDSEGLARDFAEKPQTSIGAINGGFMVFEREAIDRYFPSDFDCMLETEPLNGLASDGELAAYEHHGFWQCVDTPRERSLLGDLWDQRRGALADLGLTRSASSLLSDVEALARLSGRA